MYEIQYLNDEQVANLFGVTAYTVQRWRLTGLLKFDRRGLRKIGITPAQIEEFRAECARRSAGAVGNKMAQAA